MRDESLLAILIDSEKLVSANLSVGFSKHVTLIAGVVVLQSFYNS